MNKENEAGHNLVFASSECKEWPCVNDEVSYNNGISSGVVIGIHDDAAWIKMANGNMDIALISQLKKPKTKNTRGSFAGWYISLPLW